MLGSESEIAAVLMMVAVGVTVMVELDVRVMVVVGELVGLPKLFIVRIGVRETSSGSGIGGMGVREGVRMRVGVREEGGVRGIGVLMAVGVVGMVRGAGWGEAGLSLGEGGVLNVYFSAAQTHK